MMVTFQSKAWSSVTLFGDVAARLLNMMGHSGTVPSALLAADIPAAIGRLKEALEKPGAAEASVPDRRDEDDPDAPPPVNLRQRAFPLLELLSASAKMGCDVVWDKGGPPL